MPASGKSTWLDIYGYSSEFSCAIYSTDNIVLELAGPGVDYDDAWPVHIKQAEKIFWERVEQSISARRNIIIDRTNLTRKGRARFVNLLHNKKARDDYYVSADIFGMEIPVSLWNERLNSREGKTIPKHVLDNMKQSFEYPSYDEGFDSIVEWNKYDYDIKD